MASHPSQIAASSTQLPDAATSREAQELPKASYTPIPNALLDEVMPKLLGSEWQLLCVVIRQTQGWHDPQTGGRKESDWLSHRQLKARTGRGSDAVCHAIESLVRQGYIEVKDEQGHLLATAHERRRNGNRLFYGLAETLRVHFGAQPAREESGASSSRQFRIGKTETTKETGTNISLQPFGKTEVRASRSRASRFKSAQSGSGCGCALLDKKEQSIESPSHETIAGTPPIMWTVKKERLTTGGNYGSST